MKRRAILTALFAAPLAALSSVVQGIGLRSRRRGCCEQEYIDAGPLRSIGPLTLALPAPTADDVNLVWTLISGNLYSLTLTGLVGVDDDVADPIGPQYKVTVVHGRVIDTTTNTLVFDYTPMSGPAIPNSQNEGLYKVTKMAPITLGHTLKGIVRARIELAQYGSITTPGP